MGVNYTNVMRSALTALGLMFGLLFAAATAIVWYLGFSLSLGLVVALVTVALQYLLGPYIISLIYKITFDLPENLLEADVREFITKVCADYKLTYPAVGLIEDGNPNAFVYGHFKWDARLVVTRGLLDILNEEEQKAVIAHELGHIKNNDFILMSIVSLIPLILYQIYAWTNKGNKENFVYWVGLGAYAAYIFSQYFVLAFSRIREYCADNFSLRVMGSGEALKSALIKIAYGFTKDKSGKMLKASTIGIANAAQSEAFLLLNFKNRNEDSGSYRKLMNWDTRSVWGKWFEVNSTHPLTAKRILALSEDNITLNRPEIKQYLQFFSEAFIKLMPWIALAVIAVLNAAELEASGILRTAWTIVRNQPVSLLILGATILLSFYYTYGSNFSPCSIEELLLRDDASPVKGIPAIVKGKIIGRGIPGLFWSEDLVVDDGTGIILVDYKQPFRFLEILFGFLIVDEITQKDAEVIGWYRRSNKPYFTCKYIVVDGKKYVSYVYILTKMLGYALIAAGLVFYI